MNRRNGESYPYGSVRPVPEPEPLAAPRDYRFWPTQVLDQLTVFFLLLSVLVGVAVLIPIRALGPADPLTQPEAIKPQWYFLPLHQLTHYLSGGMVATLVVVAVLLVLLWPFLERPFARRYGKHAYRSLGLLVIAGLVGLGVLGLVTDRSWVVLGRPVYVDSWGLPHRMPVEEAQPAAPEPAPAGLQSPSEPPPAPTSPPQQETGPAQP